jgi:hypothetical protein
MLAQSIQCLLVTIPSGWLVATAGCILSALLMQVYFERSGAWEVYSPVLIKRFKIVNGLYLLLMVICLAGAYQLYRYPSHLSELIWGFIAFFFSIAALYIQHLGMQAEKKLLDIP